METQCSSSISYQQKRGGYDIIVNNSQNFIYAFSDTVGEGRGSNRGKAVINLSLGGTSKASDTNKDKWLAHFILSGLAWGFLAMLAVGATLLQYFLPPGPIWFKIRRENYNILNYFFTITAFALALYVTETFVSKNISFKHASMVRAIFVLVVFQVWCHLTGHTSHPLIPSTKMKIWDEEHPRRSLPHRQ